MDDNITVLRERINSLDTKLVQLLNDRAAAAVEIGNIKAKTGQPVYDPARENDVFSKIETLSQGPLSKGALEEIYRAIIAACRELQVRA